MATATLKNNKKLEKIASTKSYQALVEAFPPRVIRNRAELKRAYDLIDLLMTVQKPSADQQDYLELLSTLVEQYESILYPTPTTSTASLLAHLIEAKGESQTSVATATGIQKSLLSEVLSGRRKLSIENIKRLAKHFSVEPGLFLECVD